MSAMNNHNSHQRPRQGLLRSLRGGRNSRKKPNLLPSKHHGHPQQQRPVVAAVSNHQQGLVELSQISQLSMDSLSSSYHSQSTPSNNNLVDVPPMGQPSASMGSYSYNSHSSSADHHQPQQSWQQQRTASPFPSSGTSRIRSSFRDTNREIAMATKKQKTTRFAGTGRDDHPNPLESNDNAMAGMTMMMMSGNSNSSSSQGSHLSSNNNNNLSSSLSSSASRSCSSRLCTGGSLSHHNQTARTRGRHDPCPTTGAAAARGRATPQHRSSDRTPRASPYHTPQGSTFQQPRGEDLGHRGHETMVRGGPRSSGSNYNKTNATANLVDPVFARAATPRKKLDVPYPPLRSEVQKQHRLRLRQQQQQHQHQRRVYRCCGDAKNVESSSVRENGFDDSQEVGGETKPNREEKFPRHHADEEIDEESDVHENSRFAARSSRRISKTNGAAQRTIVVLEDTKDDEEQSLSNNSVQDVSRPEPTETSSEATSGHDETVASKYLSSRQAFDSKTSTPATGPVNPEPRLDTITTSEPIDFDARKQRDLDDFKQRLQKVLDEMESGAGASFQKVLQTAISAAEYGLDEKARLVREATQAALDQKAEAVREATESNLDRKAEAIQKASQSGLEQKQAETEKKIDDLLDSNTTKLNETAARCVEKLEARTEGGIARLSKFTENWLADSCSAIANRLRPYLYLRSADATTTPQKDDNGAVVVRDAGGPQRGKKRPLPVGSVDIERVKRKTSARLGCSQKKNPPLEEKPSFAIVEGEVSLTEGSESRNSARTRDDKTTARPLRRSKRTRQPTRPKDYSDIVKNRTPLHIMKDKKKAAIPIKNKEEVRKSPRDLRSNKTEKTLQSSRAVLPLVSPKNEKAPCVTPTERNSELANIEKKHTPLPSRKHKKKAAIPIRKKKQARDSPSLSTSNKKETTIQSSRAVIPLTSRKNEKALCVTPTEKSAEPAQKNKEATKKKKLRGDRQSKTKPDESSSVLRFKRRKRQTTRTQPSRKKQQEVQCEKSTASSLENDVPSEIVAFHNFQMSPLEDPDVLTFPKVYRRGSNNASKHKPTSASSKNSSLLMPKRRRKTFPKTYQKKKKIFFDVSGNDVFDF